MVVAYAKKNLRRTIQWIVQRYLRVADTHRLLVSIVQTRLLLCALVVLFITLFTPLSTSVLWSVFLYIAINLSLMFIPEGRLGLRWVRLIPDLVDVGFISLLIWYMWDVHSAWVLFYLFPIISVARYMGVRGSLSLAGLSIAAYTFLFLWSGPERPGEAPAFVLRCMCFVGIAVIAGNLTKGRQISERNMIEMIDVLGEINDEILQRRDIQGIYEVFLRKAMAMTNTHRGHIRRVEGGTSVVMAQRGYKEQAFQENDIQVTNYYSTSVIADMEPMRISFFSDDDVKEKLTAYVAKEYPPPRSAMFVPLIVGSEATQKRVIAVIALYTHRKNHFRRVDEIRLKSFAPLLEVAEEQIKFHIRQREESNEKQKRLQTLREVGELFEKGYLRPDMQLAARLVTERINSEEAAIFVWDEGLKRLVKFAEATASEETTAKLMGLEESYESGESKTGGCFAAGEPVRDNHLTPKTNYVNEYSKELMSGRTSHYMGVPLFAGGKKLGVLRVVNKKARDYTLSDPVLEEGGFDEDDQTLLETIAIQIALALNYKESLEEIDKKERYLTRVIDYSPYAVIVIDEAGVIKVFNEQCERTWKMERAKAVGRNVSGFYETEAEARRVGKLLKTAPGGQVQDLDAKIMDAKNIVIPIRLSASLISDERGNPIGSVGMFKDLRETLRHEEELRVREGLEAIARVMGYVSHDVKNKLAAAQMELQTLRRRLEKGFYGKVEEGLMSLDDTISAILYRLTNVTLTQTFNLDQPRKELVFVEDIVESRYEHLSRSALKNHAELTVNEFQKQRYRVLADVQQMQMVLTNLYDNSIYAFKRLNGKVERKISLRVWPEDDRILIDWVDNGCGIPPDDLDKIFNLRFTTKKFGSGLGLYWVKTIIENHGGSISVVSRVGEGTKFTISLPLLFDERGGG